jgi:hypothetical protein
VCSAAIARSIDRDLYGRATPIDGDAAGGPGGDGLHCGTAVAGVRRIVWLARCGTLRVARATGLATGAVET